MRALQAIVFDFDGVIADSERLHLQSYQDILAPGGHRHLRAEDYSSATWATTMWACSRRWGGSRCADERRAHLDADDEEGRALRGADGRRRLAVSGRGGFHPRGRRAHVPIAIASGALTAEIEESWTQAGMRSLFPVIVGADQTERSKPDPEPYRQPSSGCASHTGRRPRCRGDRSRSRIHAGASPRPVAPICAASPSPTPIPPPSCGRRRAGGRRACTRSRSKHWTRSVPIEGRRENRSPSRSPMPPIGRGRISRRPHSWSRASSIRGSIPSRTSIASTTWATTRRGRGEGRRRRRAAGGADRRGEPLPVQASLASAATASTSTIRATAA